MSVRQVANAGPASYEQPVGLNREAFATAG
jgi:hypothetical protein